MEKKRPTKVIGVRMEKELEKRLDDVSKKFDRKRGEIIRRVLRENLPRIIKSKSTKKKKSQKKKSFWDESWF